MQREERGGHARACAGGPRAPERSPIRGPGVHDLGNNKITNLLLHLGLSAPGLPYTPDAVASNGLGGVVAAGDIPGGVDVGSVAGLLVLRPQGLNLAVEVGALQGTVETALRVRHGLARPDQPADHDGPISRGNGRKRGPADVRKLRNNVGGPQSNTTGKAALREGVGHAVVVGRTAVPNLRAQVPQRGTHPPPVAGTAVRLITPLAAAPFVRGEVPGVAPRPNAGHPRARDQLPLRAIDPLHGGDTRELGINGSVRLEIAPGLNQIGENSIAGKLKTSRTNMLLGRLHNVKHILAIGVKHIKVTREEDMGLMSSVKQKANRAFHGLLPIPIIALGVLEFPPCWPSGSLTAGHPASLYAPKASLKAERLASSTNQARRTAATLSAKT